MDYLKITEMFRGELEPKLKAMFPGREYKFDLHHWHDNRFVQLQTAVAGDWDIHYEYTQGRVELHLEGKYNWTDYNPIWRKLVDESRRHDNLSWHRWADRNQGRCTYDIDVELTDDIVEGFSYLVSVFDPVLADYVQDNDGCVSSDESIYGELPKAYDMKVETLTKDVVAVKDLMFENFVIPEYQRPYKWKTKNVNQLINDLLAFSKSSEYRLGTLVLNGNNIVDGQQRIVTLALLLYVIREQANVVRQDSFQEFWDNLSVFWRRTKFKNRYSIANVRENLRAIKERTDDMNADFLEFLLTKCKFVVVRLPKISEAFQFFDSQNARGKDLEPHDLLKAFHLREMETLTQHDRDNITAWQDQDSTRLAGLFLAMFRVKRWVKNRNGRKFTKDNIDVFKGVTLDPKQKRYPYYLQQMICHYFTNVYMNDAARLIDNSGFEFPFQLDQVCVNGSRFFDMVRHYETLYGKISNSTTFKPYDTDDDRTAFKTITFIGTYNNRNRTGDVYVRQLFNCLLMYYVDRFGFDEINKVVRKLFRYAYRIRLTNYSVQLATIDNEAVGGQMFRTIRDAATPYDVINIDVTIPDVLAGNADEQLKNELMK